ncbi:c-type cytochrome [Sphingobacterium sp. HJSM2_6]|uniref:c-type cytochrome n=1 Tax=Sphingobacterium sp. HJSM2_6 TaxID=3366264 RepID=UPI003BBB1279
MKILKVLGVIIGVVLALVVIAGLYVQLALPKVEVDSSISIIPDSTRVKRGEYLANHVAVCMDCHSKRDWTAFSGPIIEGTDGGGGEKFGRNEGFPGTIYSSNLTPYGLKSWTDGEIYRAVTSGVGKDGRALFPLMAYHRFGQMDKEDIYSIISYIRTLKEVENDVPAPELDFPVNILNRLGPGPANHQTKPATGDSVLYGAYLINAAGCIDCHSKTDKGNIVEGSEYGGGMEFLQPAGIIRAPNITFHKKFGIGSWTKEFFVNKFKSLADSNARAIHVKPNELNSPMPWAMYGGMTDEDLESIYVYLSSLTPKDVQIEVRTFNK